MFSTFFFTVYSLHRCHSTRRQRRRDIKNFVENKAEFLVDGLNRNVGNNFSFSCMREQQVRAKCVRYQVCASQVI